eukprot:GHUV01036090.1.p2 GENE.GHUV01036090.1~~GHUV01036090.1.p2  ORF type:complete len:104 (-),score=20.24 GHUV01036090.1:185-496(-)
MFPSLFFLLLLPEMTEQVITDPSKIGIRFKPENVDIAYPPLFQSGGHFDLSVNAACDDEDLHGGETGLPAHRVAHVTGATSPVHGTTIMASVLVTPGAAAAVK